MSELLSADPLAVLLVSGATADLRADLLDAIQAMIHDPEHDVAILPGTAETLDVDLDRVLAMEDIVLAVIELEADGDPAIVLDAIEPLVEDEAAVLLGVLVSIDAGRFWTTFREGDAAIAQHLVTSIESASMVVLAGGDDVPADTVHTLTGFVRNLNPTAAVLKIEELAGRSLPELTQVMAEAEAADDQAETDEEDEPIAGEVDAWGFNSFTWTTETPLDRGRFMALFENWPVEVLRAHGVVRLADGATAVLSMVRNTVAIDEYDGDDHDDHEHDHGDHEHGHEVELSVDTELELGDDESEIAFVGIDMPVSDLVARLDACQAEG